MRRTRDFDQAVNAKVALVRWLSRKVNQDWLDQFTTHFMTKADHQDIHGWGGHHYLAIKAASVYFVTGSMSDLVLAASRTMPKEPFMSSDPIEETGFVYFDHPLALPEKQPPVRAFAWSPIGSTPKWTGVEVSAYSDKTSFPDYVPPEHPNRDRKMKTFMESQPSLVFNRPFSFSYGQLIEGPAFDPMRSFMKAFWTIAQQRIAHATSGHLSRSTVRQLEHLDVPANPVKIVTLRRQINVTPDDDHLSEPVDWSHRWLVSGHWRNQWLPSVGAHRLQWIDEYVKGPEDKPLVVKDTVFRVAR